MKLKSILGAALLLALLILARRFSLSDLLARIQHLGPWGPVAFIAAFILACVAFVPGAILTLGAGALFGVLRGTLFVSIGSILGATCAFLIGRYLARDWIARRLQGNPKFAAMSAAVGREGWKIVALMRLSPIFPFNLLNYAFGVTQVRLRDYVLASWAAMLPGTVMYVYIGSLAGNLAGLGAGARSRTPAEWALYAAGLAAAVAVSVYVARIARAALEAGKRQKSDTVSTHLRM